MTPSAPSPTASRALAPVVSHRPSRLLAGIYHDIGMAAVAQGLKIDVTGLEDETVQAVSRGVRYIQLMPRRQDNGLPAPITR
jgi:hypothetical protein